MRSPLITISLALITAVLCGLAAWSIQRGNLDEIFGAPRALPGELLYPDFAPDTVTRMQVTSDGIAAVLVRGEGGWRMQQPWDDRADARAAASILQFTQALRVEDAGEIAETDRTATGIQPGGVRVRLLDDEGRRLADYNVGGRTPWMATVKTDADSDDVELVPTTFVETRDRGRRRHVYICAGDISPLFRDGLRFLRDHRPFFFNPAALQKIRLATPEGELSLARETPSHPWRITKPLELSTDVATMRGLLQGLFDFQAVKVEEASAVTTTDAGNGQRTRIGITRFAADGEEAKETLLDIRLPADTEERTAIATVSDRPDAAFRVPVKPEPDLVSLADLPLSVNSLRDPTLTNLNIASLSTIAIRPITGSEMHISRESDQPWIATLMDDGGEAVDSFPANERRLFELLNAVTASRAISFETDAAVDMSPWGLDRPVLSLAFLGRDHQLLELDFGLDGHGGTFVNRRNTSTVMRLEDDFLDAIPVRAFEWRQARVWSISKVDLTRLVRLRSGTPAELLEYDWHDESWQAERDGEDATPELVQSRANFLLDRLEGIESDRWLAADNAAAFAALAEPFLRISVFENEVDDLGDPIGEIRRDIGFAPAPEHPGFFYGIRLGERHPFLIAEDTVRNLALPLFDEP